MPKNPDAYIDLTAFDRIRTQTPAVINAKITQKITNNVARFAKRDRESLSRRIDALDHEWDVDRTTMLLFSILGSFALFKGMTQRKTWLSFLGVQLSFLGYHALSGWCPPVSLLRRLGFRSREEIAAEKYALKTLRGDFHKSSF